MKESLVGARHAIIAALGTVLALALSTPALAAPGSSAAASNVPDGTITAEVLAANGSGCAPGTASVYTNSDKTGFKVRYTTFIAEAGGNADSAARRKNCLVSVLLTIPGGWTFAIAEADYRGKARIYTGASGMQHTNYYWQGSSENSSTSENFAGPLNGYWNTEDVAPVLLYGSCSQQRVLNINTELRVDAGTSTAKSTMSMKSSDGDVDTLFNISWIRC